MSLSMLHRSLHVSRPGRDFLATATATCLSVCREVAVAAAMEGETERAFWEEFLNIYQNYLHRQRLLQPFLAICCCVCKDHDTAAAAVAATVAEAVLAICCWNRCSDRLHCV